MPPKFARSPRKNSFVLEVVRMNLEKIEFPLPTLEEIKIAKRIAASNPEDLDDENIWILNEFCGSDSNE